MKKLILAGLIAISLPAFAAGRFYVVIPLPNKTTVAGAPNINVGLTGYDLPAGQVGQPYAGFDFRTLLSVTGDPTYTGYGVHWSLASGVLPAGLTLSAEGVLSGTPTTGGTSSFQLKASYRNKAGQQVYQIIVANIEVVLAAGSPPQAIVGQPFGYDLKPLLTVTGDSTYGGDGSDATWTVVSSTLPAGLYLTSDGWIGGTPTAGGTGSITARATYKGVNGQQTYQVVTLAVTVGLGSATPPQALVGQPYSYDLKPLLSVTGDSAYTDSAVTWSVVSSSLPSGLALTSSGVISGTPTAAGTGSITARATYKGVNGQQTYQVVTLAVTVGLGSATPPQALVGQAYSYDLKPLLSVTGDSAYTGSGVTWSVVSSSLPSGLALTSAGVISGTPTAAGTGSITARATYRGVNGQQTYQVVTLAITVSLSAATPPQAVVGQAYSYDLKSLLSVTGDSGYTGAGVTWSTLASSLPAGLALTSAGVISGTPTAAGTGSITARAAYKGVNGQQTYQVVTLAITVNLSAATPPQALVGQTYSYDLKPLLSVTGDSAYTGSGVTWSVVSSSLPAGLALTSAGVISGTPTATGTGSVTARATYMGVNGQQTYQVVTLAITVILSAATPPRATVGQAYSYDLKSLLSVTGDPAYTSSAVTWSALSSSLPVGLALNSAGVISGTPTAPGTGSVVARATYRGTNGQQTYQVVSAYVQSATTSPTSSMSFPNTDTGSNSAAQTVTLTNTGLGPLTVSTPTVQGEFSETSNCPSSLASGASCSVSVVFMPRTGGNETGSLTIPTGAGNKAISLSGRGLVYTYVSSGYYESVPVTTQQECDWHNVYSYTTYSVNPPDQCNGYTSSVRWQLQSQWFDCHGTLKENDVWQQTCQYQAGQGGETAVEYETVTTYQQQWVDTSYWAWE